MISSVELLKLKKKEPDVCRGSFEIFLVPDDVPTGQPSYGPVECSVCKKIYTVRTVRSHNGELLDPPERTVPRHRPKES